MRKYNNSYYVCPKGKNYLLKYYDKNSYERIIPNGFNSNSDWELKCFYQSNLKYLAKLCELIAEKYNKEIVWSNKNE